MRYAANVKKTETDNIEINVMLCTDNGVEYSLCSKTVQSGMLSDDEILGEFELDEDDDIDELVFNPAPYIDRHITTEADIFDRITLENNKSFTDIPVIPVMNVVSHVSSNVYHMPQCRYAENKNSIVKLRSIFDAEAVGLVPCKCCFPEFHMTA